MKNKLRSFLLRGMGAIRVDRGIADIEAVKNMPIDESIKKKIIKNSLKHRMHLLWWWMT